MEKLIINYLNKKYSFYTGVGFKNHRKAIDIFKLKSFYYYLY
jgi:hypothetical protein